MECGSWDECMIKFPGGAGNGSATWQGRVAAQGRKKKKKMGKTCTREEEDDTGVAIRGGRAGNCKEGRDVAALALPPAFAPPRVRFAP